MEANKNAIPYIFRIASIAALGGLLFGYDTAVISGTVGSLEIFFIDPLGLTENADNSLLGIVVSSVLVGCVIGGLVSGLVSLKLGRKNGLILAALLFLLSALGSAMPEMFFVPIGEGDYTFLNMFVIYRFIGGIGVGMASMLSPVYIAEMAPANIRGKIVSLNQLAIIFGMLVVYFVNYFIAGLGDEIWLNKIGWRWMFASEVIPASIFLFFLFFVPETPRYLVLKAQEEKALNVLKKIYELSLALKIIVEIKETVVHKSGKLFSYGTPVIVIGILLAAFQQFVGINVVLYYAPEIFKNMGSVTDTALLQTIVVGFINLSFTVLAIFTVDKIGRKRLQIIGALGMAFFMLALGFSFFSQKLGFIAIIFIMGYVACFAMSWGRSPGFFFLKFFLTVFEGGLCQ